MKENEQRRKRGRQSDLKDSGNKSMLGKPAIVQGPSGKKRRQYPSHPGYHGSGEERTLSPEE